MTEALGACRPSRRSLLARWALPVLLAGCGGGGGDAVAPMPPPPAPESRLAGLVCSGAAGRGWCWQAPLPSAEIVNAVSFATPQTGVAAGRAGFAESTSDGGRTWTRLPRTGSAIFDVAMVDAQTGWALTNTVGEILKTRDGGRSWERHSPDALRAVTRDALNMKLQVLDRDTVLVRNVFPTSTDSALTRDGGSTWTVVPTPSTRMLPGGVYWWVRERLAGPPTLPSLAWDYYRIIGYGATSTLLGAPPRCRSLLWPLDALRIVAQCSEGNVTSMPVPRMFLSEDGGQNWRDLTAQVPTPSSAAWRLDEVKLDPTGEGLAVLKDQTPAREKIQPLRVSKAATLWEPLSLPDGLQPFALPASPVIDDRSLWLVDGNGRAWLSVDRGQTWRVLNHPSEDERPQRLTRDATGALLADYRDVERGPDGTIVSIEIGWGRHYRSTDEGVTWLAVPGSPGPDARRTVKSLVFIDARRGFALDDDGGLLDTTDGGLTWRRRPAVPGGSACCAYSGALQFAGATQGWMIDRGRLLASANAGTDWTLAPVPAGMASLVDLQFLDARQGWAVSEAGALFATTDGGATWSAATKLPGVVKLVRFADAQVGAALVNDGVFYDAVWHTRDGGRSWAITNFQGHSGEDIVQLRYADAANLTMIGMRRDKERLWRSSDGGATWRAGTLPLANVGLTALQFLDARRGRLLAQGGVTLATEDAGDSWNVIDAGPIGDVSYFDASLSMFWLDPSTGWLGGGAGAILATVTGGRR